MNPEITAIANLIGIIAGAIFYLDGWGPSPGGQQMGESRRFRGLATVITGGVISPIIDRLLLETDKYEFFLGYLFGVGIGWLTFFISALLLYVLWKNTREVTSKAWYSSGQIAFSILEVIYLGISENPRLEKERERQSKVEDIKAESQLQKLKEKLKEENPEQYIDLEERLLRGDQNNLDKQRQNLESLRATLQRAQSSPDMEAEDLIGLKSEQIQALEKELELARNRYSEDHVRMQSVIDKYNTSLTEQEKLKSDLQQALDDFRNERLSKSELVKFVTYQRMNQYESGGLFIGELNVNGRLIRIHHGDITNLFTDVIVSSDDNHLTMGGGMSASIRIAGGEEIYDEAQRLIPLRLGDVAVTTAGKLPAKKVFHGVMIDFDRGEGPSKEAIHQVVQKSLEKANNYNFHSIAFPLLGTGTGGFPLITALEMMLSQLIEELSRDGISLTEVIVVLHGRAPEVVDIEEIIRKVQLQQA